VKDEAKLLENEKSDKEHYDLSNHLMVDGDISGTHDSLNDIRNNTNHLSKVLSEKLKELSKGVTKPYIRKEDGRKNLANITDTLQNAKIYLNKR
jgi:hypothetical protein